MIEGETEGAPCNRHYPESRPWLLFKTRDILLSPPTMKITLTVTEGPHQGLVFTFQEPDTFIVGRSKDAHFRLSVKDKYFSRNHFLVEVSPPLCRLMDMASTNGTFVNGKRVLRAELNHGDEVRGGQTKIQVTIEGGETLAPPKASPPDESDNDSPATLGPYRIERELGRGGMGVVYLARKTGGPPVALKTLHPAVAVTDSAMVRFLREADALRKLDHPHIVGLRDLGHAEGQIYFAMDYVESVDANKLLKESGGSLPIPLAIDLACQALEGLAARPRPRLRPPRHQAPQPAGREPRRPPIRPHRRLRTSPPVPDLNLERPDPAGRLRRLDRLHRP